MEKKQTALMKHIEYLDGLIEKETNSNRLLHIVLVYLRDAKAHAISLIEEDKQGIVDAYDDESHEWCGCGGCDYCIEINDKPVPSGEQYYSQTYIPEPPKDSPINK